jgi:hypothetical protein
MNLPEHSSVTELFLDRLSSSLCMGTSCLHFRKELNRGTVQMTVYRIPWSITTKVTCTVRELNPDCPIHSPVFYSFLTNLTVNLLSLRMASLWNLFNVQCILRRCGSLHLKSCTFTGPSMIYCILTFLFSRHYHKSAPNTCSSCHGDCKTNLLCELKSGRNNDPHICEDL